MKSDVNDCSESATKYDNIVSYLSLHVPFGVLPDKKYHFNAKFMVCVQR